MKCCHSLWIYFLVQVIIHLSGYITLLIFKGHTQKKKKKLCSHLMSLLLGFNMFFSALNLYSIAFFPCLVRTLYRYPPKSHKNSVFGLKVAISFFSMQNFVWIWSHKFYWTPIIEVIKNNMYSFLKETHIRLLTSEPIFFSFFLLFTHWFLALPLVDCFSFVCLIQIGVTFSSVYGT